MMDTKQTTAHGAEGAPAREWQASSAAAAAAAAAAAPAAPPTLALEGFMFDWKSWLKQFDRWESATAAYSEEVLRSPLLLNPIGSLLTSVFQAKSGADRALQECWSSLGLPTRGEQERTLHALNQLESRLFDIEEKLADLARAKPGTPAPTPIETSLDTTAKMPAAASVATPAATPAATVPERPKKARAGKGKGA